MNKTKTKGDIMSLRKETVVETLEDLKVYEKGIWNVSSGASEIEEIKGYKAIRMNRDDAVVRIVSPDYNVIQHTDAFEQTIADLDKLNLDYVIRDFKVNDFKGRNNKRHNSIQATFEFPEIQINVEGHKINATLELFNSNDTTLMFTRKFGAFSEKGNSHMSTGKSLFYEHFKHVGSNDFGNMADAVAKLPEFLRTFGEMIQKTTIVKTSNVITRGLIELGFPARLIDNLEVASEKYQDMVGEKVSPETLWGIYQILVDWLSNVVAKTNIKRADKMGAVLYRFVRLKVAGI